MTRKRTFLLEEKPKRPRLLLGFLIVFLCAILLVVVVLALSLVRAGNALMSMPGEEYNPIASHLMPSYTSVLVKPQNSDLNLQAWYFASKEDFRGNVIFVHNNGGNKLQFGLETATLFRFFMDEGFNVLALDLRHSGQSQGDSSTYGYAEYRDVLGAMESMYRLSGRKDFILYGVGSGCTTTLFTWDSLEKKITEERREAAAPGDSLLSQEDIMGFIWDTPASSAYDYIRLDLRQDNLLQRRFYARFIPDIVRLSSGGPATVNLIPLLGHIEVPVMITRNIPDTRLAQSSSDAFITECLRLKSDTTFVSEVRQAGHLQGFVLDPQQYLEDLQYFLNIWY